MTYMKCYSIYLILLFGSISFAQTSVKVQKSGVYRGVYLGQEEPGLTARPFVPELMERALGLAFSPNGKELFYALWGVETRAKIMSRMAG